MVFIEDYYRDSAIKLFIFSVHSNKILLFWRSVLEKSTWHTISTNSNVISHHASQYRHRFLYLQHHLWISIFIPYLISCHNKKTQDNANARKVTFQLLPNGCFKLSFFQAARIWKFNLLCYLLRGVIGQFLKNKKLHIYFGKYVSYIKFNQHSRSLDFLWEHIREYRTCFTPQKYCCFRVASHAARDSILISSRLFKPRSLSVSFISWNTEKSQYML